MVHNDSTPISLKSLRRLIAQNAILTFTFPKVEPQWEEIERYRHYPRRVEYRAHEDNNSAHRQENVRSRQPMYHGSRTCRNDFHLHSRKTLDRSSIEEK